MKVELENEVLVTKDWLRRLVKLGQELQDNKDNNFTQNNINYLCGYIESAETLIKDF